MRTNREQNHKAVYFLGKNLIGNILMSIFGKTVGDVRLLPVRDWPEVIFMGVSERKILINFPQNVAGSL